ncbi:DNA-binding protein [Rathayibacter rathayi]|uniref:DNA-binding protein n=1 Tax=Rathayibacter rathayi TaxID=33887 RepID=A0ABD6W9D7_RATRA|nr:Rv2175c family DNA-binding protein [Rathayibacter rathayi]AZZ48598.1 DNA-binding protein [Rathayibacter rathayi]PPF14418.1 DNA-binding protein [Rathayibacter rathayi]PPF23195.1 DNA-binding protein [Rathayibacter rathayi]PPF51509.1 DNA-binding protein [Rathayibacter rathayi]PPF83107.1 DNA-binding protein [Rathayibacter rathayi]
MTDSSAAPATSTDSELDWLTVPDLVEVTGLGAGRVRRLLEERHLLGTRRDGVLKVPALFLREGEPLTEIRGTAILLADSGFTDDEAVDWLLAVEESLGTSPILALRAGRKAEVRRVAQALA